MKRLFIGGNWKCNNTLSESAGLINNVINKLKFDKSKTEVAVFPTSLHIPSSLSLIANKSIHIGSQNVSSSNFGAFTGETSPLHLKDMGIKWTLVGHSERRSLYGENDTDVALKVSKCLENGLQVVLCIGETLEDRESNFTLKVIEKQLNEVVNKNKLEANWENIVIAYEPVWAIGTGKVASSGQAQEVHSFIREFIKNKICNKVASNIRIIYGGSVNDKNCFELISQLDIDGFLVGGASLKSTFIDIVETVDKFAKNN